MIKIDFSFSNKIYKNRKKRSSILIWRLKRLVWNAASVWSPNDDDDDDNDGVELISLSKITNALTALTHGHTHT